MMCEWAALPGKLKGGPPKFSVLWWKGNNGLKRNNGMIRMGTERELGVVGEHRRNGLRCAYMSVNYRLKCDGQSD